MSPPLIVVHEGQLTRVLPGPEPEIRLRSDGDTYLVHASQPQATEALELCGRDVVVYAGKTKRGLVLIEIHAAADLPRKVDQDARQRHMLAKWGPLLESLAK